MKKAYKQLQVAQEAVKVFEKAKATADTYLKQSLDFFEEDLIKEADVLSAKLADWNAKDDYLNKKNKDKNKHL